MNKKILSFAIVLVLVAVGTWLLSQREQKPATVSGTIEADEARVGTRFGGRVVELLADEGAWLSENHEIVRLDAEEQRARYDMLLSVVAELEAGPRAEEIAAAKHDWDSLKEEHDFAQREAKRKQDLLQKKAVSDADVDLAVTQERSLKQRMEAAAQRYEMLATGTRPERIAQARAQLAQLEAQINDLLVKTPSASILQTLHVQPGDIVPPNGSVATVLYWDRRWIRVYVPETWLAHIKEGQQVQVTVDAFTDRVFTGTVAQISSQAEFTPRNVQTAEERVKQVFGVKVSLQEDEGHLRPGMSADVTFPDMPRGR